MSYLTAHNEPRPRYIHRYNPVFTSNRQEVINDGVRFRSVTKSCEIDNRETFSSISIYDLSLDALRVTGAINQLKEVQLHSNDVDAVISEVENLQKQVTNEKPA